MKPTLFIASITLAMTTLSAAAVTTDRSYYVMEQASPQRFEVYNDGRNTYLESIPGLVVTGATADGERYIVNGVPQQIRGFMNGKPITVVRGTPPVPKPAAPDPAVVNAQIKQLTEKLNNLSARVPAPASASQSTTAPGSTGSAAGPVSIGAPVSSTGNVATNAPKSISEQAWDIRSSDKTIYGAMKRWAKTAGWQLMWDTDGNDYPVIAEASYKGQFDVAVGGVMASLERSQYPLRACLYENRAVRIIHKTKRCEG
jgi:Toxin co-regulated pilus biosynthesis protein Q